MIGLSLQRIRHHPSSRTMLCAGFTLVEMLLVVAVISLLIALLMPALGRARGAAEEVVCHTQLGELYDGFYMFTQDHLRVLPAASRSSWEGTELWQKSWVGREGRVPGWYEPAYDGPLVNYIGGAKSGTRLYRCPSLDVAPVGSGLGSNGGFDYSMTLSFGGARISAIPSESRYQYLQYPGEPGDNIPTPLLIGENPKYHNNTLSIEPGFGSIDRSDSHHVSRGSSMVSIDGSANALITNNPDPPQAWDWYTKGPSGNEVRLNGHAPYGSWKNQ